MNSRIDDSHRFDPADEEHHLRHSEQARLRALKSLLPPFCADYVGALPSDRASRLIIELRTAIVRLDARWSNQNVVTMRINSRRVVDGQGRVYANAAEAAESIGIMVKTMENYCRQKLRGWRFAD